MKAKSSPKNVNISVGGNVSGQIIVGDHNLVIGGVYGGVVNLIPPEKQPTICPRAKPVYLRPRPFSGLLDRETEQKTAIKTLQTSESLSVSGEDGIGKTAFMRYLAYNSPGDNFPDGIIYLSANGYSVDDLREYIFESFFESDTPVKPTEAQISRALQGLRALILLDDLALSYADVTQIINSIPQSSFIFGSSSRCLWGEGTCIELGGLPIKDALALLEHDLGFALNEQVKPTAEEICRELNGHPLMVMQAAGLYQHGIPFTEILHRLQKSRERFIEETLSQLNKTQQQVLFLLAASQGQPIPAKHLAVMINEKDLEETLKKLFELRLIQAHSPAYSLTGSLDITFRKIADIGSWEGYLLNYFVGWIKQNPPLPDITDVLNISLNLVEKANREHRWDDVIALGRGIERALCMIKRWEAWLRVLNWILKAAQALGNRSLESWALHQLGTRDLCLGNLEPARQALTQALNLRNVLGDKAGAAVTQQNLNLIIAPPAPPRDTPRSGPKPAPKGGGSSALKVFLTLTAVTVVAIAIIFGPDIVNPPKEPEDPNPVVNTPKVEPPPTKNPPTQKPPTQIPPTSKPPTLPPTITITPSLTSTPCGFGVWYCEDFDDRNAQFWDLSPAWSIEREGGNSLLAGSGHVWATLNEHAWNDSRVKLDLRLWYGTIHLNYRLQPITNGIIRYYVGVSEKYIYLQKSKYNGEWSSLETVNYHFPTGEWHQVEIAGWDNHIAVYIDGELVLQHIDEESYPESGTIAFETLDNSKAEIDNIEVTDPGQEPASVGGITIITPDIQKVSCTSTYITSEENTDRPGMDYWTDIYSDPIDNVLFTALTCQQKCNDDPACMAFTYDNYLRQCWLKNGKPDPVYKVGDTSGVRVCK